MWWAGADRLEAFWAPTRAALLAAPGQVLHDQPAESTTQGLALLTEWVSGRMRRPRLRLWLGGALCRPFLLPAAGLRSAAEIDLAAEALARAALGGESPRVWIAPVRAHSTASLGAAAPERLLAAAEAQLRPLLRGPLRIAPAWADALALLGGAGTLTVADGESLTALGRSDTTDAIAFVRSASPLPPSAVAPTLQRWRASGDLPAGETLHVRLDEPAGRAPHDATRPIGLVTSGDLALGALAQVSR